MEMKRVFISIELPEEIKKEILKIQKEIDVLGLVKGKFIEFENLHLTLKFLGEISDSEIRAIKERLSKLKFKTFELEFDNLGVFSEQFIRIIWVGVKKGIVFDLQKVIDSILEDIFPREHRFMGHITIARPKRVEQKNMFLDELKKIKFPKIKFSVDKIHLRESNLFPEGAQYKNLLEISSVSQEQGILV